MRLAARADPASALLSPAPSFERRGTSVSRYGVEQVVNVDIAAALRASGGDAPDRVREELRALGRSGDISVEWARWGYDIGLRVPAGASLDDWIESLGARVQSCLERVHDEQLRKLRALHAAIEAFERGGQEALLATVEAYMGEAAPESYSSTLLPLPQALEARLASDARALHMTLD